ncbi:hypothetical protein K4F52_010310, partial [Lecanicillium sp. MT-2017a]
GRKYYELEDKIEELTDRISRLKDKICKRDDKIADLKDEIAKLNRLSIQDSRTLQAMKNNEREWRAAVDLLKAENERSKASYQELHDHSKSHVGQLLRRMTDSSDMQKEFYHLKNTMQSICRSKAYDRRKQLDTADEVDKKLVDLLGGGSLSVLYKMQAALYRCIHEKYLATRALKIFGAGELYEMFEPLVQPQAEEKELRLLYGNFVKVIASAEKLLLMARQTNETFRFVLVEEGTKVDPCCIQGSRCECAFLAIAVDGEESESMVVSRNICGGLHQDTSEGTVVLERPEVSIKTG